MSGQFYDNALRTQHDAAAAVLSAAATMLTIRGPVGKTGRVEDVMVVITTAVTVADAILDIGPSGTPEAQLANFAVPFTASAIGDRVAPPTGGAGVTGTLDAGADIAADVDTLFITDGAAGAGAGDLRVIVAWW